MTRYEAALPPGAWPNWVLGNHDRPRVASRVGSDQAAVAAMLLLTLRGTPTIYYGEELGMQQVAIPLDRVQDPFEKNVPGIGVGRDGARTPMQWSAEPFAGFSTVEPWLPLSGNWYQTNVATLDATPASILSLYRRLLAARRTDPALAIGDVRNIQADDAVLKFQREYAGRSLLVLLNFSGGSSDCYLESSGTIVASTRGDRDGERVGATINLRPHEGLVIACVTPAG